MATLDKEASKKLVDSLEFPEEDEEDTKINFNDLVEEENLNMYVISDMLYRRKLCLQYADPLKNAESQKSIDENYEKYHGTSSYDEELTQIMEIVKNAYKSGMLRAEIVKNIFEGVKNG